jgi:uroporphyrinogen decarboxylase
MNSRERFFQTMNYGKVDRPPLFEDGIREEVLRSWHSHGLGRKEKFESLFVWDQREEIEPHLEPSPPPSYWPKTTVGLENLFQRLNPLDPKRLPDNWDEKVIEWKKRDYPLILRVHRGYFLTLGVYGWRRFTDAIRLLIDDPSFVKQWLTMYGEFTAILAEQILNVVDVDAALFSEPIGGNYGPLISPNMYSSFVLNSYQPLMEVLKTHHVNIIIYRTYANTRKLLPLAVKSGFNCLWACECNPQAMDYAEIRNEFGKDLRLIGGIDTDSLRNRQEDIYRSVMDLVPALLADGGFIPLTDGRVREDVPYKNYIYYRKLLESVTREIAET